MEELFRKADLKLSVISDKLNLTKYLRPENIVKEKIAFLKKINKGEGYNPKFFYKKPDLDFLDIEKKLNSIKLTQKSHLGLFLERARRSLLLELYLIKNIGKKKFTEYSLSIFGKPSKQSLSLAKKELKKYERTRANLSTVGSGKVARIFEKEIRRLNLNYNIREIKNLGSKVAISGSRKILIRKDATFSVPEVERLIVHEIKTHIFRRENGKLQNLNLLSKNYPRVEIDDEGLAIYNEERTVKDLQRFKIIILRVLAVNFSLSKSFYELFCEMKKYGLSDEETFDVCLRVKRGLSDTLKKGGFTKDLVYFSRYLKIKNFVQKGGKIKDLYIGKISLEDLKLVRNMKVIKRLEYFPH